MLTYTRHPRPKRWSRGLLKMERWPAEMSLTHWKRKRLSHLSPRPGRHWPGSWMQGSGAMIWANRMVWASFPLFQNKPQKSQTSSASPEEPASLREPGRSTASFLGPQKQRLEPLGVPCSLTLKHRPKGARLPFPSFAAEPFLPEPWVEAPFLNYRPKGW